MTHLTRFVVRSIALLTLVIATSAGATAPITSKSGADASTLERSQQSDPIDINAATLKDLRSLPGVGPVTARKIVAGRPYTSVEDLKVRKVLPVKTYDKIRDHISARGVAKAASDLNSELTKPNSGTH